jgi:hypothetical protein
MLVLAGTVAIAGDSLFDLPSVIMRPWLQVVRAASERGREHVPYRSSKLTHVLKDSLGGNCATVLIANVWGEPAQLDETLSTCRWGYGAAVAAAVGCGAGHCRCGPHQLTSASILRCLVPMSCLDHTHMACAWLPTNLYGSVLCCVLARLQVQCTHGAAGV